MAVDRQFWAGRRVLVTGHTGFKGAWLCKWLDLMGAQVLGISLSPEGTPNLWSLLSFEQVEGRILDIRDGAKLAAAIAGFRPQIVLHLAAQSLVRRSYRCPVETFDTNVMGTLHLLNACRDLPELTAIVVVTSDKCYRNDESSRAFVETDAMGGHDPYSASKGATELATASMRASFFQSGGAARVASGRAGNVIGGGDWSEDRLVPDIVRGCLSDAGEVTIRSPQAVRPWQHVLEPLSGYLILAQELTARRDGADEGWNFGPDVADERPVIDVANDIVRLLGKGRITVDPAAANLHEAKILRLDSTKARQLSWSPVLGYERAIEMTAEWYSGHADGAAADQLCADQIESFMSLSGAGK